MNIKAIAASAVAKAFAVADSILVECNYTQPGAVEYTASTGTVTPNNTATAVNALFTLFEATEGDSQTKRQGERRVIVKRSEMAAVVPTLADTIVECSTVWNIVHVEDDPTEATWAFVVKRGQQ